MVFMLSLKDMEGDNKVVNIIKEWDILAENARKIGFLPISLYHKKRKNKVQPKIIR